jgi:hypothetical protein
VDASGTRLLGAPTLTTRAYSLSRWCGRRPHRPRGGAARRLLPRRELADGGKQNYPATPNMVALADGGVSDAWFAIELQAHAASGRGHGSVRRGGRGRHACVTANFLNQPLRGGLRVWM